MLNRTFIEQKIRALKPRLLREYHVDNIGYFGSYASGKPDENSDLDILVRLKQPLGWSFISLKELLEEELGISVDLVSDRALRSELKDIILSQTRFIS